CFASAVEIPSILFRSCVPGSRKKVNALDHLQINEGWSREFRTVLRGLAMVGLIDTSDNPEMPPGLSGVAVHLVVADVNRAKLIDSGRQQLSGVVAKAIEMVRAATSELDFRSPTDWPTWKQLVPHMTAMIAWSASHLDVTTLTALVEVSSL